MDYLIDLFAGDTVTVILGMLSVLLSILSGLLRSKHKSMLSRLRSTVIGLKEGYDMYTAFKQKESDGGKKVTDAEYRQLAEQLGAILSTLFKTNEEVLKDDKTIHT